MNKLPVDRLRQALVYDANTGTFTSNRPELPRHHGKPSGIVHPCGYLILRVDGVSVRAHRAAWAMVYGEYPTGDIDHANGDKLDNRIANLRIASRLENSLNRKVRIDCASGLKGVTWYKSDKAWCARIVVKGKRKFLGYFKTKEEAAQAYSAASLLYHGEFSIVNRPE